MVKQGSQSRGGLASWTIMVYMVADDRHGVFSNKHITKELHEINAAVQRHSGAQIAAQADVRDAGTTRHFVSGGQLVEQELPQRDPGSVGTIRDFIRFGVEKHPADHYLVLFWGHGFGPAGLLYKRIVLPEQLRKAIREGLGMLRPPADIVAFMSCQISTIELAYEFTGWTPLGLAKAANHIVASQGTVKPDHPFPYDEALSAIAGAPDNPTTVGTRIVNALNQKNGSDFKFAAPFSLLNVESAKGVTDAVKILAPDILTTDPFKTKHSTMKPMQEAMHDALDGARTHDLSLLDLGRLAQSFGALAPSHHTGSALGRDDQALLQRIRAAGTDLARAIDKTFVVRRVDDTQGNTGVSIFCPTHHNPGSKSGGIVMKEIPVVEEVVSDTGAYGDSWFAKATKWGEVVNRARDVP